MSVAIEASGLSKSYGSFTAVAGIGFSIARGEICGLLGPNGAGKTTTILMLLGLTEATGGTVNVLGHDPLRDPLHVKRLVGYLPDSVGFYDQLTARENLRYTARLAGYRTAEADERIDAALARVRLSDVVNKRVGGFSHGMRQRLGLAEIIMKRPQVAILDEPTSGLDPQSSHEFLDLIRSLKHDGVAVLLSSHLLGQVQSVCDRVFLFNRGKIALQGTVPELARSVLGAGYSVMVEAEGSDIVATLKSVPGVREVAAEGRMYRVTAESDVRAAVAKALIAGGANLLRLSVSEPSLDDIYGRYFATAAAA